MIKLMMLSVMIVVLSGCSREIPVSQRSISNVVLEDGTRCVVFQRYYRGGISCDWESKND